MTREALGAYVEYWRRKQELGLQQGALQPGSRESIEQLAEAEEMARKQANLSLETVRALQPMVDIVIGKRVLYKRIREDRSPPDVVKVIAKLPPTLRNQLAEADAKTKSRSAETEALVEERRRFGNANVDLILSREQELSTLWEKANAQVRLAEQR